MAYEFLKSYWIVPCEILARNPVGNRSFGRPICRWEGNTKLDIRERGIKVCGLESAVSAQRRAPANTVITQQVL
jgi:hypothetical protein